MRVDLSVMGTREDSPVKATVRATSGRSMNTSGHSLYGDDIKVREEESVGKEEISSGKRRSDQFSRSRTAPLSREPDEVRGVAFSSWSRCTGGDECDYKSSTFINDNNERIFQQKSVTRWGAALTRWSRCSGGDECEYKPSTLTRLRPKSATILIHYRVAAEARLSLAMAMGEPSPCHCSRGISSCST